jgi:hypothetical protein
MALAILAPKFWDGSKASMSSVISRLRDLTRPPFRAKVFLAHLLPKK